jgi:hypothetical protein
MLEANPDLTPELVKEILHFTAERRGNATLPELDPFWNRDFGYGIADAYEAVKVSEGIEDVTKIDVDLQCFIMNMSYSITPRYIGISGIAWSKDGEVESVEVRIDGGEWVEAHDSGNGSWSKWTYLVDMKDLSKGNHTFEARATSGDMHSLHDEEIVSVDESWQEDEFQSLCLPGIAIVILVAATAAYLLLIKGRKKNPQDEDLTGKQ